MAPVKFDDLSKTAKDLLDNDYQTSGFDFQSKQKTNVFASVATTDVQLWPGKDGQPTAAKIGWKMPAPFAIKGFSVDKFEIDKAGKFKLETSIDKGLHGVDGLKVEAKSDLESVSKVTAGLTFTGIADTQIKLNAPLTNLDLMRNADKFTLEITRSLQQVTLGVKCGMNNLTNHVTAPDVGARFSTGPIFTSLILKKQKQWRELTVHGAYTVSDDLKVAATVVHHDPWTDVNLVEGSVGITYAVTKDTTVKAKVQQDKSLSASVKHKVQEGFTVVAGFYYNPNEYGGRFTYGAKLSIE